MRRSRRPLRAVGLPAEVTEVFWRLSDVAKHTVTWTHLVTNLILRVIASFRRFWDFARVNKLSPSAQISESCSIGKQLSMAIHITAQAQIHSGFDRLARELFGLFFEYETLLD